MFLAHALPLFGPLAIDAALNIEQRIDALDRLQGNRRDRRGIFTAPCIGGDIRQLEELPPGMGPTECSVTGPCAREASYSSF